MVGAALRPQQAINHGSLPEISPNVLEHIQAVKEDQCDLRPAPVNNSNNPFAVSSAALAFIAATKARLLERDLITTQASAQR